MSAINPTHNKRDRLTESTQDTSSSAQPPMKRPKQDRAQQPSTSSSSSSSSSQHASSSIPSQYPLKWGQLSYQVTIEPSTTAAVLMVQIQHLTGVLVKDQKITAKRGWKGILSSSGTTTTTKQSWHDKVKPGKTTLNLIGTKVRSHCIQHLSAAFQPSAQTSIT